mgnify:CR=1 FL=1
MCVIAMLHGRITDPGRGTALFELYVNTSKTENKSTICCYGLKPRPYRGIGQHKVLSMPSYKNNFDIDVNKCL